MKHVHQPIEHERTSPGRAKMVWERFKSISITGSKALYPLYLSSLLVLGIGTTERSCRQYQHFHQVNYEAKQMQAVCNRVRASGQVQKELAFYPGEIAEGIDKVHILPQSFPLDLLRTLNLTDKQRGEIMDKRNLWGSLATDNDGTTDMYLFYVMPEGSIRTSTIHHEFAHHVWSRLKDGQKDRLAPRLESETSLKDARLYVMEENIKEKFLEFEIKILKNHTLLLKGLSAASHRITSSLGEVVSLMKETREKLKEESARNPTGAGVKSYSSKYDGLMAAGDKISQAGEELDRLEKLVDALPSDEEWDEAGKSKDFSVRLAFLEMTVKRLAETLAAFKKLDSLFSELDIDKISPEGFERLVLDFQSTYYSEMFARAVQASYEGKPISPELSEAIIAIEINGMRVYPHLPPTPSASGNVSPPSSAKPKIVCPLDEIGQIKL